MKILQALSIKNGVVGVWYILDSLFVKTKIKNLYGQFVRFLTPVVIKSNYLKRKSFSLRHEVYCNEYGFEPKRPSKLESDGFDRHAFHCLIQHKFDKTFNGTVRVVHTNDGKKTLPIEALGAEAISEQNYLPSNFSREKVCEISRLAVPKSYRTALTSDSRTYVDFPHIAIGLYMSAASMILNKGFEHVYVMMEPRLARSLVLMGIRFKKIGPTQSYHGQRAPYYINPQMFYKNLSSDLLMLLNGISGGTIANNMVNKLNDNQQELNDKTYETKQLYKRKKCIERATVALSQYCRDYKTYWVLD